MAETVKQKHFILVHGTNHGAWCWYKVKPRLEAAGHRVTALDLAASGINMKSIHEVHSFYEYTEPLLEILASLPPDEKIILVGHSLGGLNLALAMDKFPEKISVAVFLSAFMPDTNHDPSYILEQLPKRTAAGPLMDTQISPFPTKPSLESLFFGPEFLKFKLYQLCPVEDLELAKTLTRPGSLFSDDLEKSKNFSNEGYGSIARVYIVCEEDMVIPKEFQHWTIENYPVKEVMEIKRADHMAMFSKPQEVTHCLLEIAHKHA
ncbi:methylesterase 1-like [Pistacia vera]|uniref:methylesterase 1-like n=1 Tax=Pistacia vera TaxID=55513 RepID=UPI001263AD96|nr:methylesterase 1-like [Pistacia vera]